MVEPLRKSLYDILQHTLKLIGRKTFVHRYIYIGEFRTFPDENINLETLMKKNIKELHSDYYDEPLTGLLLIYKKYFIHIVDASGDTFIKHVKILLKRGTEIIIEFKLLSIYHHINQRLFDTWDYRFATPPTLLEKIDPESDFEETKRYLSICISKVYNLAIQLRCTVEDESQSQTRVIGQITSEMNEFLPECSLIYFLLQSPYPRSMENLIESVFVSMLSLEFYTEYIWPVRGDFVPYDVFDKEKNPIKNLATVVEKQKFTYKSIFTLDSSD